MHRLLSNKWTKVPVFLICLAPLATLIWRALTGRLGANPVEFLQHATGLWTLRFLIFTLTITPLRKLLKLPELIRFRRMLGLFAFFYVCLHFLTYIGPDQSFNLAAMWKDVGEAPLHHRRFPGICALDSARHYFHRRLDSPPGRQALANVASIDLHHGDLWCDSLLLAGEVRRAQSTLLRCARLHLAALAARRLVCEKGALGARENRPETRNEPRFRQRFLAPLAAHETTQQTLRCRRPTPRHQ